MLRVIVVIVIEWVCLGAHVCVCLCVFECMSGVRVCVCVSGDMQVSGKVCAIDVWYGKVMCSTIVKCACCQ